MEEESEQLAATYTTTSSLLSVSVELVELPEYVLLVLVVDSNSRIDHIQSEDPDSISCNLSSKPT